MIFKPRSDCPIKHLVPNPDGGSKNWQVYAITARREFIKFGFSQDALGRLIQLQVGMPMRLELEAVANVGPIAIARAVENDLHLAAARYHVQGEWFACNPKTLLIASWLKFETEKFFSLLEDCISDEQRHMAKVGQIRRYVEQNRPRFKLI